MKDVQTGYRPGVLGYVSNAAGPSCQRDAWGVSKHNTSCALGATASAQKSKNEARAPPHGDVAVTAEAVHSRQLPPSRNLYLTGFRFLPGRLTGYVRQARIDRLIEAVIDAKLQFLEMATK